MFLQNFYVISVSMVSVTHCSHLRTCPFLLDPDTLSSSPDLAWLHPVSRSDFQRSANSITFLKAAPWVSDCLLLTAATSSTNICSLSFPPICEFGLALLFSAVVFDVVHLRPSPYFPCNCFCELLRLDGHTVPCLGLEHRIWGVLACKHPPGLGRSPGEGNGNPLQYSCLENPMDRGAWWGCHQSTGLQRVRHDLATKQQPNPHPQPSSLLPPYSRPSCPSCSAPSLGHH